MKKLVSLVLALVILIGCLPMSAFAVDLSNTESVGQELGELAVVNLKTDGNGGYVLGSGSYSVGSTAVITATLYPNSEFYGWYENGELISADFVYDFTVKGDTTITAKFKNIPFYNFNITSTFGGVVEAAVGQYCEGSKIEVTAIPDEGYEFAGWVTDAGKVYKANYAKTEFLMPGSEATLTAKFVIANYVLGEWVRENHKWKYLYNDGSYAGAGWAYIDNEWYYFDKDGYMMSGWIHDNYWYYINPSNGIMQRGWIVVDGEDYYMDETGVLVVGWLEYGGKKYYFNPSNGIMQRGWVKVEGKWYYFDSEGAMLTDWQKIEGVWYFFDNTNGDMKYGWVATDGELYYLNEEDGSMTKGWKKIDGKWYYFHETLGTMQKGWVKVDGEDYYLSEDGSMHTGWLEQNGKKYYFNTYNGIMQRGVIKVDGKLYFMDQDGVFYSKSGWFESDGKKYFINLDGSLTTEWKALNGDWYYFNPNNGAMQTGWASVEGLWHEFSSDGVYLQVAEPIGKEFTAKITTNADLKKAVSLKGSNVELRTDDGLEDQQWKFILQNDGSYKIVNLSNNKCLDVADGKTSNGTNIQVYNDNGFSPQRWVITRDGENKGYTFRPVCSINHYTVMDVLNEETADGTNIVLSKSHFGLNQQFTITKIDESDPSLPEPKYCLVGNINGNDAGSEGDWESIINVFDINNQITLTFTQESYVFIKDVNNENWFMTLGWEGKVSEAVLYNTHTTTVPDGLKFDKLYVPEGTYTFTLIEKSDGTLHLSYTEPVTVIDTLYLVPGSAWTADDARFAAYYFNTEGGKEWVSMTDEDGDGIYEAPIPEGDWTNVIFCRMNPETTENDWNNKWNQTGDLTLEENSNCFTITRPWSEVNTGIWSLYKPGFTPDIGDPTQPTDPSQDATEDTNPSITQPVDREYCLIGYIDGKNVGDDDDWENVVNVFDENNQFTLTVENEAYVCLKDTNCSAWFMTLGWVGDVSSAILYNTSTTTIPGDMQFDKLRVPAGTYKFTLAENFDGTVKLSYEKVINDQVSEVIGDIDNSGKLTIEDATYIQKTLVGIHEVAEQTKLVGDVSGDGKLTIRDATLIQLYLANKIEHFPVENVG